MPYYPDPYSGIGQGISSMGDSLSKAITGYYEDKDKGDFANRMFDEYMRIPGAVPEDIMAKFPKMSSTQKSDALVAVQFRMHRAAEQAKEQRAQEDQEWQRRINAVTYNNQIREAAKAFAGGNAPQLGQDIPTSRGTGVVTSVPGGGSLSLPPEAKPSPTPRAGQVDLDAQGRPRVDLQRNIFYSGGVPMILTGDMRKQFEDAQSQGAVDTKGLEGQISRQEKKSGQAMPPGARYGSREEKIAALREQRQSKLGLFGTPSAGAAEPTATPSPAAAAIAPDRVRVIGPPDARGVRPTGTVPHQSLQPYLKANPGWAVVPETQASAAPAARPPVVPYGQTIPYQSQEEQDLQDLYAV